MLLIFEIYYIYVLYYLHNNYIKYFMEVYLLDFALLKNNDII